MPTVNKVNDVLCVNISKVDDVLKTNAKKMDDVDCLEIVFKPEKILSGTTISGGKYMLCEEDNKETYKKLLF